MTWQAIASVDGGCTIVELASRASTEDTAIRAEGSLDDAEPVDSYEDAIEALDKLEKENF